jgi:plasmid stabilization system protein ParE
MVGKYLIFYKVRDGRVVIARILHSARRRENLVSD